jgi:hypothetical protein
MRVGDLIDGEYLIESRAGAGSMGTVFRARSRRGTACAIKVLTGSEIDQRRRFAREVDLLAQLEHPHIVHYLAHGETAANQPYLVMDWLDGETLSERLKRAPLTTSETLRLGVHVADALAVAHARGVIHRDLKPSNLMLRGGDVDGVCLIDFGIARWAARTTLTGTGATLGTPGYMAPEQAKGLAEIDARSDIYSLACVLFHCLTSAPPFTGEDSLDVLLKIVREDAPRLRDRKADAPRALDELLGRMLDKEPDNRPTDGGEVAVQLRALAGSPSPLSVAPRPLVERPALTNTERRVRSVVLARVGPAGDEARDQRLRDSVAHHQGVIEVLPDGTRLIVLAGAEAPVDLATRAARCAIAIRSDRSESMVAIVSGRGVVTADSATGEVIERGLALLATRGDPSDESTTIALTIRLDETTAGLLGGRFAIDIDSGGFTLGAELSERKIARTLLGKSIPCVGRERDLALLASLFEECISEPRALAAVVTGAPGIGKSRLVHELIRRLGAGFELFTARGDPMREGAPFGLVAQLLRNAAGVRDGESIERRRARLRSRVTRHVPAEEAQRVTEFLGEVAGVPFTDDASAQLRGARRDTLLMGDQMRRAFESFLLAEANAGPIIILLEDVHWGDLPSLSFVDLALRTLGDRPMLALAVGRPEALDRFPGLWAQRLSTNLVLRELSTKASQRLVLDVLGDADPARVTKIVEHAAGNPFLLEELVRASVQGRDDVLPDSVLAMIQLRVASLDDDARRVLRAGSVFGEVFWTGGVRALTAVAPDKLARTLAVLVDRELLHARSPSRFAQHGEYAFRHNLLREAVYAMLTDEDRVLGHHLAGAWLEAAGESDSMTLAEHFERGGKPERALTGYLRAAEQALEGNDFEAALARATRARAGGADGEALGRLALVEATAHGWRAEYPRALYAAREAMQRLPHASDAWFAAAAEQAAAFGKLSDHGGLLGTADRIAAAGPYDRPAQLIALGRASLFLVYLGHNVRAEHFVRAIAKAAAQFDDEPIIAAWVARVRAQTLLLAGDPATYFAECAVAVELSERAGDLRQASVTRVNLGFAALELGEYARAEALLRAGLAEADHLGLVTIVASARHILGLVLMHLGRMEEALDVEHAAHDAFVAQKDPRMIGGCLVYLARIHLAAGDLSAAEENAAIAIAQCSATPAILAQAEAVRAFVDLRHERYESALDHAMSAHVVLQATGALEEGEALIRLAYAESLARAGHADVARDALDQAYARLLERAARLGDAALRESFLRNVPENARTLALVAAWQAP